MPLFDNSASQPKARVRTEIQNGIRMHNSINSRCIRLPRTHKRVIM